MDIQDYELLQLLRDRVCSATLPLWQQGRLIELCQEIINRANQRELGYIHNRLSSLSDEIERCKKK